MHLRIAITAERHEIAAAMAAVLDDPGYQHAMTAACAELARLPALHIEGLVGLVGLAGPTGIVGRRDEDGGV
ncbi:hypothetical protein AB0A77_19295 [Streptomyces varsoviensis]|uniref:hypothetical protein n=1 Tax=Streptomyces varsoviensis TaxID=67373 RepID=UPI0033F3CABC